MSSARIPVNKKHRKNKKTREAIIYPPEGEEISMIAATPENAAKKPKNKLPKQNMSAIGETPIAKNTALISEKATVCADNERTPSETHRTQLTFNQIQENTKIEMNMLNEWIVKTQQSLEKLKKKQEEEISGVIKRTEETIREINRDLQLLRQSIETNGPMVSGIQTQVLHALNKLEINQEKKIQDLNNQLEKSITEAKLSAKQVLECAHLEESQSILIKEKVNDLIKEMDAITQDNHLKHNQFRKITMDNLDDTRQILSVSTDIFIKNQSDKLYLLRNIFNGDLSLKDIKTRINMFKNQFPESALTSKNITINKIIRFGQNEFKNIKEYLNINGTNYINMPHFQDTQDLIDDYCSNYVKLNILVNFFTFLEKNPICRKKHTGLSKIYQLLSSYGNVANFNNLIQNHPETYVQLNPLLLAIQKICKLKAYPDNWIDILKYQFSHSHFLIFKSRRDPQVNDIYSMLANFDENLKNVELMKCLNQTLQLDEKQIPVFRISNQQSR